MMTSQVVRVLEGKGYVARHPSQIDKRALAITPTATGVEQVNRAIKTVEAVDKRFFGPLGSDLASLIQMMRQLIR